MHAPVGGLVEKLHWLFFFYFRNALDGRMDLGLTCYPSGLSEEWVDGSSCADSASVGPDFCGSVVHPSVDVLELRHVWGEQVQVGDV